MILRQFYRGMSGGRALTLSLVVAVLLQLLAAHQVDAQRSNRTSPWQTLTRDPPIVIARGGFSGLLQDSSYAAYNLAMMTSVPNVVLWCDVQLTKDDVGICFPNVKLDNASNIANVYKNRRGSYQVNGVRTSGWFALDFTLKELGNVSLTQAIFSRSNSFDDSGYQIMLVEDVATQLKPPGFWLNIQSSTFYAQHNLSMTDFVLSVTKQVAVNYISSPEIKFLQSIVGRLRPSVTKHVFRFLDKEEIEPSTNQTYESLLSNLTFVKTFASGILVPKSYIWPVDTSMYLLPHTSLVGDAHKQGLEIYASEFANDYTFAYDYSYDPIAEYLYFIDNGEFAVDGMLSDFPITSSEAIDCFAHLGRNASVQGNVLVITEDGASGDYPGCTDLAYEMAIAHGADVIDCPVQMSKDGTPFCLSSIDIGNSTTVAQSLYNNLTTTIPELSPTAGTYSFSLTWSEIQSLRPSIANPFADYNLFRNPKFKNSGQLITLAKFLELSRNSTSLSGVLISVENAAYLAEKQGLGVVDAVLSALTKSGYNDQTSKKVMIASIDSSVLMEFKQKSKYELVYIIKEKISDILVTAIEDIKKFADSVIIRKKSVFPVAEEFITGLTDVVAKLQKLKLQVYARIFSNEFVSQAWDFFSDPIVEINSYVQAAGINGVITDFPKTSARYKRNRCLGRGKNMPSYMNPVQPGGLLQLISPALMPPAEAPNPVFTAADVTEPPLPPVTARAPASGVRPATTGGSPPKNSQTRVSSCLFLSILGILLLSLLAL